MQDGLPGGGFRKRLDIAAHGIPQVFVDAGQQRAEKADERVVVRHILVAFRGTIDGVGRTHDEAEALAAELYTRAVLHEDFDALRQRFSDDKTSGRYEIEKSGRRGFAKNFGDVAFRLQRGEIGIAPWHETDGEFGWHVIERLQ